MSRLIALRSAETLSDVAGLLGFTATAVAYLLYRMPASAKYVVFSVPKRDGGMRVIQAPCPQLKLLQRNLANLLQDCWEEICLDKGHPDTLAHGFKRRRTIVTNARAHRGRRFVFNTDLKDFFPSINFGRVRGFFLKNSSFALCPTVATVIAQIACHENALPQGSPCSPAIANLIGHVLDIRLAKLAATEGCRYSRYADDLTFSTNLPTFPSKIASPDIANPHTWNEGRALARIVSAQGFAINSAKTRMQYRDSRQEVTGLVVNRRPNVRREYRNLIRAMTHNVYRKGSFDVPDSTGALKPGSLDQLQGMLSFVDSVDLHDRYARFAGGPHRHGLGRPIGEVSVAEFGTLSAQILGDLSATERILRRFLLFRCMYSPARATVICEGPTDNVYITHALHRLSTSFPTLVAPKSSGGTELRVRLLRYDGTRLSRLLGLGSGGGDALASVVDLYSEEVKKFRVAPSAAPCIVLVDNDSGSKPLLGRLKRLGVSIPPGKVWTHVSHNLYALLTPLVPATKAESCIEDFFDTSTKAIKVGGKSFHTGKGFDHAKHYGKMVFAHKVVRPNAATIDFSGFAPLLQQLSDIALDWSTRRPRLFPSAPVAGP